MNRLNRLNRLNPPARPAPRPRHRPVFAILLVAAALAVLATVGLGPGAGAARAATGGPVLDRNFPDPDVVKVGDTYHAYATNGDGKNIQHATSTDLVHWSVVASDALPAVGSWALAQSSLVWAPDVFDNGDGLTMYYTARDRASGKQCIGAAKASSPDGPFTPVGDSPLVCPAADGGAIDASSYTENGQRYILWKNDGNCCGIDTWLHIQPVNADGTGTTGSAVSLIKQDRAFEGNVIEAPTLVKRAGHYILLYSAGNYSGDGYATSYAVSDSLTGPYIKAAAPLMTTDSFAGTVRGPGGQDVVVGPDGRDHIVFHGWNSSYSYRALYVADLGWANGNPVVRGSKVIYQAENALLSDAVIRDATGALDGRAVGKIDYADSYVEFTVFAASAGPHTLSVRFGNGSLDAAGAATAASHGLTVNGVSAGSVSYPYTGWDNWQKVDTTVTLHDGWNTLRLSKGNYYTELDSIEVA